MKTDLRLKRRHDWLAELAELRLEDAGIAPWEPLPHQIPPDVWSFWLMEAGRGAGKTATASHVVTDHINGPPCISKQIPHRVALIAPTLGDAIESAAHTDMALARLDLSARFTQSAGGSMVRYANGSQVRLFGCHTREDVERLRAGGNRCFVWAEEIAAWRYLTEAWDQMQFGLRLGPNPQIVGTTTPKARPEYVKIRNTATKITHATTLDNPELNAAQVQRLLERYEGTSLGEQELYGHLIEEAEGALWTSVMIDADRLPTAPSMSRIVVAVDPPGGATEAGIVAAGLIPNCPCGSGGRQPHFAVLEDGSEKLTPDEWGTRAVDMYRKLNADRIVAEMNFGGDMVESVIRTIDADVPFRPVRASRGKAIRAEPVVGLYEQRRVHHIGTLVGLEEQMVQWVPDESKWSPDRIDALVWAISELSKRKPRKKLDGWSADPDLRKTRGI